MQQYDNERDPDKIETMIADLAERVVSLDHDELKKAAAGMA